MSYLYFDSYLHTGIQEDQIIYVFLSNRTYPTMENRKLIDNNIRTDIKKIVFD